MVDMLTNLKTYLRIDTAQDDHLLNTLITVAKAQLYGAIETDQTDDPRFDHAVFLLVAHYYDNRSAVSSENLTEIPFGVVSLIQQLRGL